LPSRISLILFLLLLPQTKLIQDEVATNGGLIARFPGGAAGQAALLAEEGFTIDTKGKVSKVKNFRESLVRFD
jgi:hypothetical protein